MTNCSKDLIIFIGEHAQTEIIYFLLGKKKSRCKQNGKKAKKKKKLNTNTSNNLPILLFIFFSSIMFNI